MASVLKSFSNLLNPGPIQVPTGGLKIDWLNPLASSLIGCWVPGVTRGVDLTGNSPVLAIYPTAGAEPTAVMRPEGPGLFSPVTGTSVTLLRGLAPPIYKTWTEASIYWRGYLFGNPGAESWAFGISYDSINTAPYALFANVYTGGKSSTVWNSNGSLQTGNFSQNPSVGLYSVGSSVKVNGLTRGYVNGQSVLSTSFGAVAQTSTATSQITLNGWWYDYPRQINGTCYVCYFWNRQLSDEEMAWIHLNPYSLLASEEYELPIQFSAPSFIPAWAAQSTLPVIGAGTY